MEMDDFDRFNKYDMEDDDMYSMMKYMRHSMNEGEHFKDSEAKYLVAEMYHVENGRKHVGEKYDMHKAKEIIERYRGILPTSATPADVYVAINTQYHDTYLQNTDNLRPGSGPQTNYFSSQPQPLPNSCST